MKGKYRMEMEEIRQKIHDNSASLKDFQIYAEKNVCKIVGMNLSPRQQ